MRALFAPVHFPLTRVQLLIKALPRGFAITASLCLTTVN